MSILDDGAPVPPFIARQRNQEAFCPECNGDPQVQPCECCAMHRADMAQDRRCDDLPLATFSRWMGPIALLAGFAAVVLFAGPYVKAFGEWMGAGW